MISGGRLNSIATVLRASDSFDAIGKRVQTFTENGTIRCDLRTVSQAEIDAGGGVSVLTRCEIRARWGSAVRAELRNIDRLRIGARTFAITSIENREELNRLAVIQCEALE